MVVPWWWHLSLSCSRRFPTYLPTVLWSAARRTGSCTAVLCKYAGWMSQSPSVDDAGCHSPTFGPDNCVALPALLPETEDPALFGTVQWQEVSA